MSNLREKAYNYLMQVPETGITSNGATAGDFTRLTGYTHAKLQSLWAGGSKLTTCNEFVGFFGRNMGAKDNVGRFDIDSHLKKLGKSHAWVPKSEGKEPKCGDVFLIRNGEQLHMGVSLSINGDTWKTVESGQGGRGLGYDAIKRLTRSYSSSPHLGFVDLELFVDPAKQDTKLPAWLTGWWTVMWRSDTYFYYFDSNKKVRWTKEAPGDISKPPAYARDWGSVAIGGTTRVTVRWGNSGSVEIFNYLPFSTEDLQQMSGKWNGTDNLAAYKM